MDALRGNRQSKWRQRSVLAATCGADDLAIELDDLRRGTIAGYRAAECGFWERFAVF